MTAVELVSVNVGLPDVIGVRRGKPVMSGIRKRPVDGPSIWVGRLNLAGDRQADLSVHGGPDKAAYAYPSEHVAAWNEEFRPEIPYGPGSFGDNLTTRGWLETYVRIGDVWAWGAARLLVVQPRYPCYKLAITAGRPEIAKPFIARGRTGWYFRVIEEGEAPTAGPIEVIERDSRAVTVMDAHRALTGDVSRAEIERVSAVPALAERWRETVLSR